MIKVQLHLTAPTHYTNTVSNKGYLDMYMLLDTSSLLILT